MEALSPHLAGVFKARIPSHHADLERYAAWPAQAGSFLQQGRRLPPSYTLFTSNSFPGHSPFSCTSTPMSSAGMSCVSKIGIFGFPTASLGLRIASIGMKNSYQHRLWIAFKEEVIELDGAYVLAGGMSRHGVVRPEHGWDYVGEDDLGGLMEPVIVVRQRYDMRFYVQHPHWEPMTVGTLCCDGLTGTKMATELRKFDERLKRFNESKRWKLEGDAHLIQQKQIEIRIYKTMGGNRIEMAGKVVSTALSFFADAKKRVFEFIEMVEQRVLQKRNQNA